MNKKIKYLVYVLLAAVLSCGVHSDVQLKNIMDTIYIGMSESEFKEKIEGEENIKMDSTVSIYKVTVKSNRYLEGWTHKTRFFYFSNNKLVEVGEGESAYDTKIKIDKTIKIDSN